MPRRNFYEDGGEESETEPYAASSGEEESDDERSGGHRSRSRSRTPREGRREGSRGQRPRSVVAQIAGGSGPSAEGSSDVEQALASKVAATVTENLKGHLQNILGERQGRSDELIKEVEELRAAQRHASLLSEASELQSESAQRQFAAFVKIKSGVANARRLMAVGDAAAADRALNEVEKQADFRLDMIRRADSLPGGWAAANVYERRVAGNIDSKNDKIWRSAVEEANKNRKMKRKGSGAEASQPPFQGKECEKRRSEIMLFCSGLKLSSLLFFS